MNLGSDYTHLEIRILKQDDSGYPVELTIDSKQQFQGGHLSSEIHPWVSGASPTEDGERLFKWLFDDERLQRAWAQIRGQSVYRRIRLRIDDEASELHTIPWELLRDPNPEPIPQTLAADVATPFSRYLAGQWEAGQAISTRPIKMLIAIANPAGLEDAYNLSQIDVVREREIVQEALFEIGHDQLIIDILDDTVSLPRLAAKLQGGVHLLHIVAHGMFSSRNKKASLYLADEDNDVRLIKADEFSEMLSRQKQLPQLVYLSSCETATSSPADIFRGFGPRLVSAGVPAVVAMQDLVPVTTAQEFARTFYHQLIDHGQVDLASNAARAALLDAALPGGSIPVLFSRLTDNLLLAPLEGDAVPVIERKPFEPETVIIPDGSFVMGRPPGDNVPMEETPAHEIALPAYRIGKYPVTNAEYGAFIKQVKTHEEPQRAGWFLREPPADKLDHPVIKVSWHDAQAYCRWLSDQTGRLYRLPTEAEWEKAARGADGRLYPWGDEWLADRSNANNNEITSVTAYPYGASPYGCEDMVGNVQEWTNTLWGSDLKISDYPYPYQADDGRETTDADEQFHRVYRVHRGGSYSDDESELSCSARSASAPASKLKRRGFRVVLDIA